MDEDEITMDALEAGADDIEVEDGVAEIVTAPSDMVLFVTHLRKSILFLLPKSVWFLKQ